MSRSCSCGNFGQPLTCCCFVDAPFTTAVVRAQIIAAQADIVAAMTLEALSGTQKAFDAGESIGRGCT